VSLTIKDDEYFIGTANPLATIDQLEIEDRAMRLLKQPELEKARRLAAHLWRNCAAYPAWEQMSQFDSMIDEYVFNHALWAANNDARDPKISWVQVAAHRWFGRDVPGSRWGGESPDALYRQIPIAHGGVYEIRVRPTCKVPPMSVYSLMSSNSAQPVTLSLLSLLDSPDMVANGEGEFVITVDDTPAQGRTNHLQTKVGADHLNIRDVLGDWLTQTPNALRVGRLDAGGGAPPSDEELAKRAAQKLLDGVYFAYYCSQSGSNLPPNEIREPVSAALTAGLSTQLGSKSNISLADDEALVITANAAGARFRSAVLYDLFSLTIHFGSHTSSLNMTQMAADEDGKFTYVVAHEDPGVHNWLDTCGLNRTMFGHRWQSFPREGAREAPTIRPRVVKFRDLDAALPAGIRKIDAAGRREQIDRRKAGFDRRFLQG